MCVSVYLVCVCVCEPAVCVCVSLLCVCVCVCEPAVCVCAHQHPSYFYGGTDFQKILLQDFHCHHLPILK